MFASFMALGLSTVLLTCGETDHMTLTSTQVKTKWFHSSQLEKDSTIITTHFLMITAQGI